MHGLQTRLQNAAEFEWRQSVDILKYFYKRNGSFEFERNSEWKKFRWRSAFEIIEYTRELDKIMLQVSCSADE